MDNVAQFLALVLSSGAIGAVFSRAIDYFLSERRLAREYKNEYFKQLIAKRLRAYDNVEVVIGRLAGSVLTNTNLKYPMIFNDRNRILEMYSMLTVAQTSSIWLGSVEPTLRKINELLLEADHQYLLSTDKGKEDDFIKAGVFYMNRVEALRFELIRNLQADIGKLHDIEKFIKWKSRPDREGAERD